MDEKTKVWLDRIQLIRSIAQTGLQYCKNEYDIERYEKLQSLAYEMYEDVSNAPIEKITNFFIPDTGYATPKVDLRAGVFKEGKILLVKERSDGKWTLPGGWADVLESPSEGIIREVKEESGFDIIKPTLVAVIDREKHEYQPAYPNHIYKLFFIAELTGGEAKINLEVDEIDFFPRDQLPELSVDRVLEKDITRLFDVNNSAEAIHEVYSD